MFRAITRRWTKKQTSRSNRLLSDRRLILEPLEDRRLLALVGVSPSFPLITYDALGPLSYNADAQVLSFQLDATPLQFRQSAATPNRAITSPSDFFINIHVDNQGHLIGGGSGSDLIVTGNLDIDGNGVIDYSGTLLTGEVTQFGYSDSGGTTDLFDFRFVPTGGPLAPFYAGKDIGVKTTSESSTFTGTFATNFVGYTKGTLGSVSLLSSSLSGYVYDDGADNDGIKQAGDAGIPGVTVNLTGTDLAGNSVSLSAVTDSLGAYSFTLLRPGTYTITEVQPAGWLDGQDTQGTPGTGANGDDILSDIVLGAGVNGQNNNFGELPMLPGIQVSKLTNATTPHGTTSGGQTSALNVPAGSPITWIYTVSNTGNTPLQNVSLADDQGVVLTGPIGDVNGDSILDTSETWMYSATGTAVAGYYCNTATVTGSAFDATGTVSVPVSAQDTNSYFGVAPGISVTKATNGVHDPNVAAGDDIVWTYTVTNTGNVDLSNVALTDDQGVVPVYQSGDDGDGLLDPGETWTYTAAGTAVVGDYSNTATATGMDATGTVTTPVVATATDGYFGVQPGILVTKLTTATTPHGTTTGGSTSTLNVPAGSPITWIYTISNTGNAPLANVALTDNQGVVLMGPIGDVNGDGLLDTNETWMYSATGIAVAGYYSNTAIAVGVDATGTVSVPVTAEDTNSYFGAAPAISVTKLTNNVHNPNVAAGSLVTWTYTVTNEGNVDLSGIAVADDQGITPVYQSGDNGDGLLNPGEAWTYVATGTAVVGDYSNVATVTGTDATHTIYTPVTATATDGYFGVQTGILVVKLTNGTDNNVAPGLQLTAGSSVTWTYQVSDLGNVSLAGVTLTDSDVSIQPTYQNGDANANGLLDLGEIWVYTATGTAIVGQYSNTATVSGQDATGTVAAAAIASDIDYYFGTAASAVGHGDFATIGFWHNKNGQTLIKALNGSATSTALGQWLATSFPNLYGQTAGVRSMVNSDGSYFTNAQVAASYNANFFTTGTGAKTNAQILAAALASYATSTTLAGGTYAKKYGFNVSVAGTGGDIVNLGAYAAAFGGNATQTVLQMLQSVNSQAVNGVLYANSSEKSVFTTMANDAFDTKVNSAGDLAMMVLGSNLDGTYDVSLTSATLHLSALLVYVDNTLGNVTAEEAARINESIATLNAELGSTGVQLIEVPDEIAYTADITISLVETSDIGGVAEGVLGLTEMGGTITIVSGWNWYTGTDPSQIAANQFDFGTVATHELGHAIGLGHSGDRDSVMSPYLTLGEVRHDLTANDIALIGEYQAADASAMTAEALRVGAVPMLSPSGVNVSTSPNVLPSAANGAAATADVFFQELGKNSAAADEGDVGGLANDVTFRQLFAAFDSTFSDRSTDADGQQDHDDLDKDASVEDQVAIKLSVALGLA